jgi:hypothetical protein
MVGDAWMSSMVGVAFIIQVGSGFNDARHRQAGLLPF